MDESTGILLEQVERLLAEKAGPALLRSIEGGEFPQALWAEVAALGLPLALVPEAAGGAGLGWDDAVAVWQALGRHAAPLPLAEGMLGARLLAEAGEEVVEGEVVSLALPGQRVPWGRFADIVALPTAEGIVALHTPGIPWDLAQNTAGEPRDTAEGLAPTADDAALLGGALMRSAQIAGALQAVLDSTVDYANTRKQFGRAIGGFQAVQQLLARAAGEVAAAGVAAAHAGRAASRRGLAGAAFEIASAKVVAGEAAGTVAAIAHQVFAAIGFTQEHHLHLYTRRLWSWRDEFGAERYWARRIGTAALQRGGAALWPDLTAREEPTG